MLVWTGEAASASPKPVQAPAPLVYTPPYLAEQIRAAKHAMEQLAPPGSSRLTAATCRLVEGLVQVNTLGRFPVKGLAEPVEVFELTGATTVRRRLQATAARSLTRFVGRQRELEVLSQALGDRGLTVAAQLCLGHVYRSLGNYPQAGEGWQNNVAFLQGELLQEHFGLPSLAAVASRSFSVIRCSLNRQYRVVEDFADQVMGRLWDVYRRILPQHSPGYRLKSCLYRGDFFGVHAGVCAGSPGS